MRDRTLDVIFSTFGWNSFTITPWQKPRGVSRSRRRTGSLWLVILRRLRETSLGFCLRVIVNDFHSNLEKTTSRVLSVIIINLCFKITDVGISSDLPFKECHVWFTLKTCEIYRSFTYFCKCSINLRTLTNEKF